MTTTGKSAYERAVAALARRALTASELRLRLARAGHPPPEIDAALRRLAELRLVDDRAVAYNHARSRAAAGRKGPARVRAELAARGIPGAAAQGAVDAAFDAEGVATAAARAFARFARGRPRPLSAADLARIAARLARAGFPVAIIRSLLASEEAGEAAGELLLDAGDDGSGGEATGVPRDAED